MEEELDWLGMFTMAGLRRVLQSVKTVEDFQSLYLFSQRVLPDPILEDLCHEIMGPCSEEYNFEVFDVAHALALKWRLRGNVDPNIVLKKLSM